MASLAVGASLFLVEFGACLSHEILRKMSLLDNLMLAVSIRAPVAPAALAMHLPVLAHLGLLLLLVLPHECIAFSLVAEVLNLLFVIVLCGHFWAAAE